MGAVVKIELLVNPCAKQLRASWEEAVRPLVEACRERGVDVTVHPCDPARLTATARALALAGATAVVALGGDGTVSAVASGLLDTNVPLGVLPMGTMNNFSKDLGLRDMDDALDALASDHRVRVDVGEVNGHVFVNNSSIGVYPRFVLDRDRQRRQTGARDWWLAIRRAARRFFARYKLHVTIKIDDRVIHLRTPFVFVGNNPYSKDVRMLGRRERLDLGVLDVFALRLRSRFEMFVRLLRAIVLREPPPDVEELVVDRAIVATKRSSIHVALDGEVVRLDSPLEYRSRHGALVVLAPRNIHEARRTPVGPSLRRPRPADRARAPR